MRSFHKLKSWDSGDFPRHLIFIDTETTTIKESEESHQPKLRLGVAEYISLKLNGEIDAYRQIVFKSIVELEVFLTSIISLSDDVYMYAHNWSFDFPVLSGFSLFDRLGFEIKSIVDASPPVIIVYKRDKQKVIIVDNLNYFRLPLASIGESIGYPKLSIDLDNATDEELISYCKRDCEILRKSVLNLITFLLSHNLSGLKPTVSSISFHTYIKRFMPCEIYIDGSIDRTELGRKSYFGGRTECFRIGKFKGPFYLIDINSQYPFVMKNNDYPVKAIKYHKRVTVQDIAGLIHTYCATIKCRVDTHIPCFPKKIDDRTCFPVGSFITYLSTPEIIYGLDNDLITDVYEVVWYEKARIFDGFVDYFYNKRIEYRKQGNDTYQLFCKLIMNSLYGKYGQTGQKWELSKEQPRGYPGKWFNLEVDRDYLCKVKRIKGKPYLFYRNTFKQKRVQYMEIDGKVWRSHKETESNDSFPAIAAHVTANGRIYLQRMMDFVGKEHIYYCDTDSLFLTQKGFDKVKDRLSPTVLGQWSLDGTADEIEIRGAKDYTFGQKEKIKGVRKKHVITNEGLYRQLQFRSLRGCINAGELDKPLIRHTYKRLKRVYLKGNVGADGWVTPFVLRSGKD